MLGSLASCELQTSTIPLQAPVLNPGCKRALPVDEPEPENITRDIHGRPRFDLYRDLCGTEQIKNFPTCEKSGHADCAAQDAIDHSGGPCLNSNGPGVCVGGDYVISVVSFGGGNCWEPLSFQAHARACCPEKPLNGFDCRGAWPYASDGKVGQLCARHADCQAGLQCKTVQITGNEYDFAAMQIGLCTCPEQETTTTCDK
jgi:hypothetical protein